MKITLAPDTRRARTVFHFESGPYDAVPPIGYLCIEHRLKHRDADRMAIAIALMLRDFIAAELELPLPCSPEVAQALEAFFAPFNVRISSINFEPIEKESFLKTAIILPKTDDFSTLQENCDWTQFGITSERTFLSTIETYKVFLASNVRMISGRNTRSLELGVLGLCILFSFDMSLRRISVPDHIKNETPNWIDLEKAAALSNVKLI